MKRMPLFLLALLCLTPSLAHAHTGIGATHGFFHGARHPLTGLDHIGAMIAVGLWAAQMGGRSVWAVPLAFVSVMAFGGFLGISGVGIPLVEPGIALSVLTLGVLIAAAVRLPVAAGVVLVGLFALCHGHAHGAEMPETASGLAYGLGFICATAFLHGIGLGLGFALKKFTSLTVVRCAGGAIAGCGLYLVADLFR